MRKNGIKIGSRETSGSISHPDVLLPNEVDSILKEASERCPRDHLMILLTLLTGLRNSEVINLNICTVAPFGPVSNILELPSTIAKGGKPRKIPLREDLILAMENFLSHKRYCLDPYLPTSPLFISHKTKKRLSPRDFQRITRSISTKVLSRSINPHMFRHTFATNLLNCSNIRIVQTALGHSNIQSTAIYTHPTTSDLMTAISKI